MAGDAYGFKSIRWVDTRIQRGLESRGLDYWESGMDMKLPDDIYDSFRTYQRSLLREYASMGDEFNFRVIDARRAVDAIQHELRKQVDAFLERVSPSRPTGQGRVHSRLTRA